MKPALIIFDFDGTLADTLPWFAAACGGSAFRDRPRPADTPRNWGASREAGERKPPA